MLQLARGRPERRHGAEAAATAGGARLGFGQAEKKREREGVRRCCAQLSRGGGPFKAAGGHGEREHEAVSVVACRGAWRRALAVLVRSPPVARWPGRGVQGLLRCRECEGGGKGARGRAARRPAGEDTAAVSPATGGRSHFPRKPPATYSFI